MANVQVSNNKASTNPLFSEGQTLRIINRYIKDLSIESKNTIIGDNNNPDAKSEIHVNFEIKNNRLVSESQDNSFHIYEVILFIKTVTESKKKDGTLNALLRAEIEYCGSFAVDASKLKTSQELEHILYVECAKILYPSARDVLFFVTSHTGLSPISLDIDMNFDKMLIESRAKNNTGLAANDLDASDESRNAS